MNSVAVAQQCPGHVYEARAAVSRTRSSAAGQRLLLSVISLSATAVAVAVETRRSDYPKR